MNSPVCALRVGSAIFGLVGLVHLIRILAAITVQVGSYPIGRRWSAVAVIILAALSAWLWKVASETAKKSEMAAAAPTPTT